MAAKARGTGPGPLRRRTAVEPLRDLDDGLRRLVLVRDRGGEDVRVAMVVKLRRNPTSPSRHTPTAWWDGDPPPLGWRSAASALTIRRIWDGDPPNVGRGSAESVLSQARWRVVLKAPGETPRYAEGLRRIADAADVQPRRGG